MTYSEIFGQRPTDQYVKVLLGRCNQIWLVTALGELAAVLHNEPVRAMSAEWQRSLIREHESVAWIERLGKLILRDDRILAHQVQVGLLIRYALSYSEKTIVTIGDPADNLIRLFLAVNELYTDAIGTSNSGNAAPRDFLRLELQSGALPNERLSFVLNRTYQFISWADSLDDQNRDFLPIKADFERLLGIPFEDYAAAAFAFFSHYLVIKTAKDLIDKPVTWDVAQFAAGIPRPEAFWAWLKLVSRPVDDLIAIPPEFTFTVKDLASFIRAPLVIVEGNVVLCPLPSLLENTLGTGLYFALFDAYKQHDGIKTALRFTRLYGQFFEDYVADLLNNALPKGRFTLEREKTYSVCGVGESKSTDIVLQEVSTGKSVFIEVTKKRFRLVETVLNLDISAFEADVDQMVVEKGQQIDRSLRDLADGRYSLTIPVTDVQPVVVGGQPIPGPIAIPAYIREELTKRGALQNTAPLVYMSIEDVEALSVGMPSDLDLFRLLREKAAHSDAAARAQSIKNYLYFFRPDISRKKTPRETTPPGYSEFVKNVVYKGLERWGLNVDWSRVDELDTE